MTSVVRRVLDAPDASAVVDYFEDVVADFEHPPVGLPPQLDSPRSTAPRGPRATPARKQARKATRKPARKR